MDSTSRRRLPAVDKVLAELGESVLPRPVLVAVVRRELDRLRTSGEIPQPEQIIAQIRGAVRRLTQQRIGPVINATGVLIHTNLGRAPLGPAVVQALSEVASNYSGVEFDLSTGQRGQRAAYLEHNLALLCGAEAATVVNNNAAALVLVLRHLCRDERREVVISRGELVQIGGGFRIPDVLEASGAMLREVGTTNHTSVDDYAQVLSPRTALLLKVHQSCFFMGGFVESPTTAELAELAQQHQLPLVEDLGSGAVVATERLHPDVEHEPTPAEVLGQGVDLVTFSGDKLLGGPQAGIVAGAGPLVEAIRREPFFRAVRCDKLVLAALQTVVDDYLHAGGEASDGVPLHALLTIPLDQLRQRGERIVAELTDVPLSAKVVDTEARIGGGSLPRTVVPSVALSIESEQHSAPQLAAALRAAVLPVIGTIQANRLLLDLRTVFARQDQDLLAALRQAGNAAPSTT